MPGKEQNHPSERDEHLKAPGHHPGKAPQQLDRRRAGGGRESGESAKEGTGPETERHTEETRNPTRV